VDIFYSHRFDPQTPLEETMGALDAAVRQGKALLRRDLLLLTAQDR
jgi:L-glyceraldehyde 3-phosphate reductase